MSAEDGDIVGEALRAHRARLVVCFPGKTLVHRIASVTVEEGAIADMMLKALRMHRHFTDRNERVRLCHEVRKVMRDGAIAPEALEDVARAFGDRG
eukprot:15483621-Alexandrium_andersonii.AAC.1